MPTMQENIALLKRDIEAYRDAGATVTTLSPLPLVVVHDITEWTGRRCVTYFTATHWDSSGVLRIGYLSPSVSPYLYLSGRGVCSDATPCEIAKAMCIVWEDASRRLCRSQSLQDEQAEPIEAVE